MRIADHSGKGYGMWFAKLLPRFRTIFEENIRSPKYALFQYIAVNHLIDIGKEPYGWACL